MNRSRLAIASSAALAGGLIAVGAIGSASADPAPSKASLGQIAISNSAAKSAAKPAATKTTTKHVLLKKGSSSSSLVGDPVSLTVNKGKAGTGDYNGNGERLVNKSAKTHRYALASNAKVTGSVILNDFAKSGDYSLAQKSHKVSTLLRFVKSNNADAAYTLFDLKIDAKTGKVVKVSEHYLE